jgi:hypothetical protein
MVYSNKTSKIRGSFLLYKIWVLLMGDGQSGHVNCAMEHLVEAATRHKSFAGIAKTGKMKRKTFMYQN